MALKLNDKYVRDFISQKDLDAISPEIARADKMLREKSGAGNSFLGWMDLPVNYDREEFERIKKCAKKIQGSCDAFIVIGIGGSYLGARAVIEFLNSNLYNDLRKDTPAIYYAGNSISSTSMQELIEICKNKDVCINVISKSGTTTEPAVAFRIFRSILEEKYGEDGARERIYVTTDKARGTLKSFTNEKGYESFVIPDDVGGRFSVLTAVGLLPIAVSGIDIDALMSGAQAAREAYTDPNIENNDCYKYAAIRNLLYRSGKTTEILVGYEAFATMFHEWWKQLYGESEGKDNKGIYPSSVVFSTDLHSLGQYIQEGLRNIFETVIAIGDTKISVDIPYDEANVDGLNFLSGMSLDEVKNTAMKATLLAHVDGGVPNVLIEVDERSAYDLGWMIYFFELSCAISGYVLGVNPFDQPGVEAYKKNMFALLGKPGYEDLKASLTERLGE